MSKPGMPDPMARRLGYALKRAQHALRTQIDAVLRPLGLTAPQYAVLTAIELDPGISNAALARAAFVKPPTMQGIVGNLEREGLLRRVADPNHGRILKGVLTAKGQRTLLRAHTLVTEIEASMIAAMSPGEITHLTEFLLECANSLTDSS